MRECLPQTGVFYIKNKEVFALGIFFFSNTACFLKQDGFAFDKDEEPEPQNGSKRSQRNKVFVNLYFLKIVLILANVSIFRET